MQKNSFYLVSPLKYWLSLVLLFLNSALLLTVKVWFEKF